MIAAGFCLSKPYNYILLFVFSELYEIFVLERLAQTSKMKVCDSIKLAKTKTMNTWMNKIEIKIDDKVIKLREERHLWARFLIIQQSRKLDLPK